MYKLTELTDKRKVLMTFQVSPRLRQEAMDTAKKHSINISEFLRQQVEKFVQDFKRRQG